MISHLGLARLFSVGLLALFLNGCLLMSDEAGSGQKKSRNISPGKTDRGVLIKEFGMPDDVVADEELQNCLAAKYRRNLSAYCTDGLVREMRGKRLTGQEIWHYSSIRNDLLVAVVPIPLILNKRSRYQHYFIVNRETGLVDDYFYAEDAGRWE